MRVEIDEVGGWLRERLPGLAEEHGVPGVAVAVGARGRVVEAAAGVLSTATGVEATVDSVFQIGSVAKALTATLVMGLVAEGLVELDTPVARYLPGFREATVRQLLCHTAGFEGDVFTDTGKGDDCLERYVELLADVPQIFEPGRMFSYNNAGYSVLGRIVEVVRGEPFDRCMRDRLFTPLGMTHAASDPYEAILHRAAVGHLGGRPAPVWTMARSNAPAGSMLAMTARDLLAFARTHLTDEGLRACGSRRSSCRTSAGGRPGGWAGSSTTCRAAPRSAMTATRSGSRPSCGSMRAVICAWRSSPTAVTASR